MVIILLPYGTCITDILRKYVHKLCFHVPMPHPAFQIAALLFPAMASLMAWIKLVGLNAMQKKSRPTFQN
jgi:hypothetical protein